MSRKMSQDVGPGGAGAASEHAGLAYATDDSLAALLRAAKPRSTVHGTLLPGGSRLQGERIEIVRRLGSGSMGTVYEARDRGTQVALKTLNYLNPDQLYRLKREFRTLTEVSHPNVVVVYELLLEGNLWFFTMECVRGQPLDRYWSSRRLDVDAASRTFPVEDEALLRRLISEISAGVCAIHDAGLLHRDLKPTNMIVEPDGRVVILDFGLVSGQLAGGIGQTIQQQISGTPGYMAPEQAAGAATTTASDWYAVGVIIYQLLTGRLPHAGSLSQLLNAKLHAPVVRPRSLVPEIPEELDALCCALLQREPAARPTTETMRALARTYAAGGAMYAPAQRLPVRETSLVGRADARERLAALYRRSQQGPVFALVRGESGMGKTELLRSFIDTLQREHDPFVARGRCYEREAVPYKALDEAIDDLTRILVRLPDEQASQLVPRHAQTLTRLFPVLLRVPAFRNAAQSTQTDNEAHLQRLGFVAMRELLGRIADRRPLVMVIDDLHWSDVDSLRLLVETLSAADPPHFLLIGSCRSGHASAALDELLALPSLSAEVIDLDPLGHEEAVALSRANLPPEVANPEASAARIARESRGHPLYVIELSRAGSDRDDGDSLEQLIQRRVRLLPTSARTMLELASVTTRPLPREVLLHACADASYPTALAALRATKLVHCTGASPREEALEPYHDRVRAAVVAMLDAQSLVQRHDALASALERWGHGEPEWLAQHLQGAGRGAEAHHYAVRAARKASQALAFNRAADLFSLASALGSARPTPALEREHAAALACAGRGAEAAEAYLRAARSLPQVEATRLEALAAAQQLRVGHIDEAVSLLREVLSRRGIRWPESVAECVVRFMLNRARIRASGLKFELRAEHEVPRALLDKLDALHPAHTALGTFDYLRGACFASIALPLALKAGEPRRLVTVLAAEAIYNVMLDGDQGRARARAIQDTIEMLAGTMPEVYGGAVADLTASLVAYWEGHWGGVVPLARRAEQAFTQHVADGTWETSLVRSVRATVAIHGGELPELAREVPGGLLDASERNDRYAQLDHMRSLVVVHLRDDRLQDALRLLGEIDALLERFPVISLNHLVMSVNVSCHLYAGAVEAAKRSLDARWRQCRDMGLHRFPLLRTTHLGMLADCTLADVGLAPRERASQLRTLARMVAREPLGWAPALAKHLEGHVALLLEKPALAVRALDEAHELYLARGMTLPAACVRREQAASAASRRADELRAQAEAFFSEQGIVRPDRFARIVHSVY